MLIKVEGLARPEREDGLPDAHKTTYINFAWVEDLRAGVPVYATDDEGKTIVDKDGNKVVKHGTTVLFLGGSDHISAHEPRYYINEGLDKVVERIDAALQAGRKCCDPTAADEDDAPQLNDRGVWLPGESYVQLDVVKHPEDVSKRYVALQASKSTSVLVLANTGYWCKLG